VAEARAARVLSLTVEVQDCDKALGEASNERDKVMGQGKDSLSRVRLAKSIRERDDEVRDLRRVFATRTLQLEMERILAQLEEEACEVPSLETPDRADEVELLAAEFGAMDAGLKKLAWMVDTDNSAAIEDDDLTELATDIPDLKSRLGLVDGDGLSSLSPSVLGERVSRTTSESLEKAKEGAEFMARGVKMLGGDISASTRFFGRAVMGSTLRPREVQTIRRTTLDIFTFVPFIIILIIPLTPVGHVLIFSFIQRYFPALFPSQFSGRRQELMKKYEELSLQLKEAERSKEIREEDEALARAVTAVESLMMGGASDEEVAKAARAATAAAEARGSVGDQSAKKSNSFFKLKGLERMASGEDVVDVEASERSDDAGGAEKSGKSAAEDSPDELETLRRSQASLRSTLSFTDDDVSSDGAPSR
jgi:HAMP domain-containing protein